MALLQKLKDDLNQSLKKGDKLRVSVLRMVIANVNNAEIDQRSPLDDGSILAVIAKQAKQHHESIDAFSKGNRPDLQAKEESELAILQEYLPEQLSRDEIVSVASQVISEIGASGPGDKGKVMAKLMNQLKGKADGREINAVVSELLANL